MIWSSQSSLSPGIFCAVELAICQCTGAGVYRRHGGRGVSLVCTSAAGHVDSVAGGDLSVCDLTTLGILKGYIFRPFADDFVGL